MIWILYALANGLTKAGAIETDRRAAIDSGIRPVLHAGIGAAILLLALPFMTWTRTPEFYLAGVLTGSILAFGAVVQSRLQFSRRGRVGSVYMPMEAFAAFILWLVIKPGALDMLVALPVQLFTVMLAFLVAILSLATLRAHDVDKRTFTIVAPVGISFAAGAVITKLVLPVDQPFGAGLAYVFIVYLSMMVVAGAMVTSAGRGNNQLSDIKIWRRACPGAALSLVAYGLFVSAIMLAPNPGYVSFLAMLLPVWMLVLHKILKVEDRANAKATALIVLSALILIAGILYQI